MQPSRREDLHLITGRGRYATDWNMPGQLYAAVLRSPWDYADRLDEFLAWCERCASQTLLLNPIEVVRWNTDKHYLADLARAGIACVPSTFAEPGEDAQAGITAFLGAYAHASEFVVKPAVAAGEFKSENPGELATFFWHQALWVGLATLILFALVPWTKKLMCGVR